MEERFATKYGFVELKNGGEWDKNVYYHNKNCLEHSVDDKPAYIHLYEPGNKSEYHWYKNGKLHRDTKFSNGRTKPAVIQIKDEESYYLAWMKDGKLHNSDVDENGRFLPAVIATINNDNDNDHEGFHRFEYWIEGKNVSYEPNILFEELGICTELFTTDVRETFKKTIN